MIKNKNNNKGFTIVELVIVIAVIAILAAVLIPTFSGIIKKANYSNDLQVCKNMNTQLAVDFPDNTNYAETVVVAKASLTQYKNSFKPKSNEYHYYWCEVDNRVYLVNDINAFNISFPETDTNVLNTNSYRLDKEYCSISTDIEGITLNKKIVEKGSTNVEVTLNPSGDAVVPEIAKIGDKEYVVANNKISISSITSNIVINKSNNNYLSFTANTAGSTIKFNPKSGTWKYSTDLTNWNDGSSETTITLTNVGDKVYLKGENCTTGFDNNLSLCNFTMTGSIAASGDVTSLTNNGKGGDITLTNSCYSNMFSGCTSLTQAPELPATTLANMCYMNMFKDCTSLTQALELPATTLADACYLNMFYDCTSLTQAPELPATTLAMHCYRDMFFDCTSLTQAPELPATTLADACYFGMFCGCTSLTQAPELPATTLVYQCYVDMFCGCTSLTQAPELPVTTLAEGCYEYMFKDCTSLTQAPELPATTLVSHCYYQMFMGCTSLKITTDLEIAKAGLSYGIIFGGNKNTVPNGLVEMFKECSEGPNDGTPEAGENITYYWYISE